MYKFNIFSFGYKKKLLLYKKKLRLKILLDIKVLLEIDE